jgi:ankyrin repeat protein
LLHHKDINVQMMNKNGETPLDIALDKNHSEIIDLLCKFQSTQKQPIVCKY